MKNFFQPAQFIIFLAFLLGGIFFIIGLTRPVYYQAGFTAAVIKQEINSANINSAEQESQYALDLLTQTIPSDAIAEKMANKIQENGEDSILLDFDAVSWSGLINLGANDQAKVFRVDIQHQRPRTALFLASKLAEIIQNDLGELTNNPSLELKILEKPSSLGSPDASLAFQYSAFGTILGAILAFILILIFKEKTYHWMFHQKRIVSRQSPPDRFKPQKKNPSVKTESPVLLRPDNPPAPSFAAPQQSKSKPKLKKQPAPEAKSPSETDNNALHRLSDDEIKERLNRLINGDI